MGNNLAEISKLSNRFSFRLRVFFDLVLGMGRISLVCERFCHPWNVREAAIHGLRRYTSPIHKGMAELRQELARYLERNMV